MRITPYYNIYTNQASDAVVDEIVARIDALSALNRNISPYASSKQFFAVRDRTTAKPELLRKFQEWRDTKVAFGEVRAFRKVSRCCQGKLKKEIEAAPFLVSVVYDDENNMVPGMRDQTGPAERLSYGDIKYSVSDGLNKPSFYNGQPQAFLQTISVTNEGYAGAVQKVRIRMRVFTREAFEVIDKWFLRPGNEMLVKFGWSIPLSSTDTATEVIHAIIFNFNASITEDGGWDIIVHGIAKGNVAVGLGINASADLETITQQLTDQNQDAFIVPSLTTVLQQQLKEIKSIAPALEQSDNVNGITADDTDGQGGRYGILYESGIFPHGIGRIKFLVENTETLPENQEAIQPYQGNPDNILPASDDEFNQYIESIKRNDPGDWDQAVNGTYRFTENLFPGDASLAATLTRYFANNFGYIQPGLVFVTEKVWPDPLASDYKDQLYKFYTNTYNPLESALAGITTPIDSFFGARNAQPRPETPELRKRVWLEMEKYVAKLSENILQNSLSDEEKKREYLRLQEENRRLEELKKQTEEAQRTADNAQSAILDLSQRITNPQSSARYYISLGDLVYYFNEKVFRQAPELYDSVQILVENQITTYDPNVVSSNPTEVIFSNALNYEGGMSRYGDVDYGFLKKRVMVGNQQSFGANTDQATNPAGPVAYTGNTGDSTGAHLDVRWADQRQITAEDADRYIQVGGKRPSSFGVTSGYGPRKLFGRSYHRGIDFGTPVGTPITLINGAYFSKDLGDTGSGGIAAEIETPEGPMRLLHLSSVTAASQPGNTTYSGEGNLELVDAEGADGVAFLNIEEFSSKEDMRYHSDDWGVKYEDDVFIAAFNIAHIWISVDVINELYVGILKDKAIDPQYKTILIFFENIFSKIADASGGIMQLTFAPDLNELYESARNVDMVAVKSTNIDNPLLKQTHMLRIVDANHQLPYNLGPKTLSFKVNDVNATILRDLNINMKLPSKMQSVAYTFGRQGLNDDIVDINEETGVCSSDNTKLIETRDNIFNTLNYWKSEVGKSVTRENLENLQNALIEYAKNPIPFGTADGDTSRIKVAHQGWLFSRLYPIELQLKLDGISGFLYGNKIEVLNALPERYSDVVYFTLSKIEHEVVDNDWITTLTGIARLKFSDRQLQFPNIIQDKEDCGGRVGVVTVDPIQFQLVRESNTQPNSVETNPGTANVPSGRPSVGIQQYTPSVD
jgi:hypothetical protein